MDTPPPLHNCAPMVLATTNKASNLLLISYIQRVDAAQIARSRSELALLVAELPAGFRMLSDLTRVDSFDVDCAREIGKVMEFLDGKVSLVVRVIPDPSKDIGLNILSVFHYANPPRMVSCETMVEAARLLAL